MYFGCSYNFVILTFYYIFIFNERAAESDFCNILEDNTKAAHLKGLV